MGSSSPLLHLDRPLPLPVETLQQVADCLPSPTDVRNMCEAFEPRHTGTNLYAGLMAPRKLAPAAVLADIWQETGTAAAGRGVNTGVTMTRLLNGLSGINMQPARAGEPKQVAVPYDVARYGVRAGSFQHTPSRELQGLLETVAEQHLNAAPTATELIGRSTQGTFIAGVAVSATSESFVGQLTKAYCREFTHMISINPLHVAHTLLGALMLESLLRWCAKAEGVEDLNECEAIGCEAMVSLQSLSIDRCGGSLMQRNVDRLSAYHIKGNVSSLPECFTLFIKVKQLYYFLNSICKRNSSA